MKWMLILLLALPAIAGEDAKDEAEEARKKIPTPHLLKTVGSQDPKGSFAKCIVSAGTTRTSQVVKGDEGEFHSVDNKIVQKDLDALIKGASKETKMNKALHVRETVPNVVVSAGISFEIKDFKLLVDASDLQTREGKHSAELIKIAEKECGKLKPAGEKREK